MTTVKAKKSVSVRKGELKVATWLFRVWLLVSIVANGAVGVMEPAELPPIVAAAVHAAFPLALASAELLLVRVSLTNPTVNKVRLWFAGGIGAVAFAGSAKNLAHLAVMAGFGDVMAWALPVIVDLMMAVAMLSVVSLANPTTKTTKPTATSSGSAKPVTTTRPAASRKAGPASIDVRVLAEANPGWTQRQLADAAGVSVRTVRRRLNSELVSA